MKRLLFICLSFFFIQGVVAQAQNNNWYFCRNNGLSFNSGDPVVVSGGQVDQWEGASSISDKQGRLLFYTDGIRVWNKNHSLMPNGNGLAGGSGSSTQSCIIIPKTNDEKQYYIFTADEEGGRNGLHYSVVDLTLNGGLGDVTVKNTPLITPTGEKVTAVRHCNKKDYWVITHHYGTNSYYAYLATASGVNPTPVISNTGSMIRVTYATMGGQLKASPDGKKIIAMQAATGAELSDFNNRTGVLSNTTELFGNDNGLHWGAEFSADSKKLYLAIHGFWYQPDLKRYSGVYQYDLSLPTTTAIIASKYELIRFLPLNAGAVMQRGPNGKIYITNHEKNYLSVINSPELIGALCDFKTVGISLPNEIMSSLPNLVNDHITTAPDSFRVASTSMCVQLPIGFSYTATGDVQSIAWDFGDPASGTLNYSTTDNPSHIYSLPGNYSIRLVKLSPCGNDTLQKQITIGNLNLTIGNDTVICENSRYTITAQTSEPATYLWQDGSKTGSFTANAQGLYWLKATSIQNGCSRTDSLLLQTKPLPALNLGSDTTLCTGESFTLTPSGTGVSFVWQDNSTNKSIVVQQAGVYWVEAALNGCTKRDSISVSALTKPKFSFGPDQYLCPGQTIQLNPGLSTVTYQWQDGSVSPDYRVQAPGLYVVAITNTCGTTTDSISFLTGNCIVRVPSAFTPNRDGLNDGFQILGTSLVTDFELKIFDRYGQLIFFTRDKLQSWNGEYKGEKLPAGTYPYVMSYKEAGATATILKGTVLLMR